MHAWVYSMDRWVQNSQMRETQGASYIGWHLASQDGNSHSCGSPRCTLGTATYVPAIVQVNLTGGRHSYAGWPHFKSMTICFVSVTTSDHSSEGSPWSCPADNTVTSSPFLSLLISLKTISELLLLLETFNTISPPHLASYFIEKTKEIRRDQEDWHCMFLPVGICASQYSESQKSSSSVASLLNLRKGCGPHWLTHGGVLPLPLLGLSYHSSTWDLLTPKFYDLLWEFYQEMKMILKTQSPQSTQRTPSSVASPTKTPQVTPPVKVYIVQTGFALPEPLFALTQRQNLTARELTASIYLWKSLPPSAHNIRISWPLWFEICFSHSTDWLYGSQTPCWLPRFIYVM